MLRPNKTGKIEPMVVVQLSKETDQENGEDDEPGDAADRGDVLRELAELVLERRDLVLCPQRCAPSHSQPRSAPAR